MTKIKQAVILFDGDCSFCNFWVRFISKRDHRSRFRYVSQQSDDGRLLLGNQQTEQADSVALILNGKSYAYSTAVLRIAKELPLPWRLCYAFVIVPRWLRDPVYRWVARHRHRFFKDECKLNSK